MLSLTGFYPNKNGFSLMELAIVVAIIGLLASGVTYGRSILEGAKIRAQVAQLNKVQTATTTFRLKYGYLPGDVPADVIAQFPELTYSGTGTGFINSSLKRDTYWQHLLQSNLFNETPEQTIPIPTDTFWFDMLPRGKFGNTGEGSFLYLRTVDTSASTFLQTAGSKSILHFILITNFNRGGGGFENSFKYTANPYIQPSISSKVARDIDIKMDDGVPNTGLVLAKAATNVVFDTTITTFADTICADDDGYIDVGFDSNTCFLMFRLDTGN